MKPTDSKVLLKNFALETNKLNLLNKVIKIQNPLIKKTNTQTLDSFFKDNLPSVFGFAEKFKNEKAKTYYSARLLQPDCAEKKTPRQKLFNFQTLEQLQQNVTKPSKGNPSGNPD